MSGPESPLQPNERRAGFALDKRQAVLMGVAAGIARSTGIDPLAARLAIVLATIVFPVTLILYLVAGWVAPRG